VTRLHTGTTTTSSAARRRWRVSRPERIEIGHGEALRTVVIGAQTSLLRLPLGETKTGPQASTQNPRRVGRERVSSELRWHRAPSKAGGRGSRQRSQTEERQGLQDRQPL
jgi:hypothetical protein